MSRNDSLGRRTARPSYLLLSVFVALSGACGDDSTGSGDGGTARDTISPTDAAAMDSGAADAGTDVGVMLEGCARFCADGNLTLLSQCLNDGQPITGADCMTACTEEELAGTAACVETADDCDAVQVCLADANPTPVTFEVSGTDATMRGVIDARTIQAVADLLENHPSVTRIIMQSVPGSANDTANLRASRMIREAGLATHVPADGEIASGGVDFFCAGATRTADVAGGARLGVHSWAGPGVRGDMLPRENAAHQPYLDYYAEMGIPADFYWFTLEAAPPEGIHWMTEEEVSRYMLTTP